MRRMGLSTTAAIVLILGVTAAGAQSGSDTRRADDPGQAGRIPGQTLNDPSQQRDRTQGQSVQDVRAPRSGPHDRDAQAEPQSQSRNQDQGTRAPQDQAQPDSQALPQDSQDVQAPEQKPSQQGTQVAAPPAGETGQQNGYAADRSGAEASDRIALSKEQQNSIGSVLRQRNIQPVRNLNFSLTAGTRLPDSVPLVPVPDTIVAVLPQFLNYSFFVDEQQQLVMVDPSTRVIKARVPIAGGTLVGVGSRTDTERAAGRARRSDKERVGANAGPETERSIDSPAPHSAPGPRKRLAREVEGEVGQGGESADDVPSRKRTQSDQRRSTVQSGAERRKTVRTETDVTVGSAMPETVEIQGAPPAIRRVDPPVRQYRRVGPEGGPVPARPADHGILGIFDIFR